MTQINVYNFTYINKFVYYSGWSQDFCNKTFKIKYECLAKTLLIKTNIILMKNRKRFNAFNFIYIGVFRIKYLYQFYSKMVYNHISLCRDKIRDIFNVLMYTYSSEFLILK